jgi:hypothetical protein
MATAYVHARMELGASLSDEYVACNDDLTAKAFHAKSF